MSKEIRKSTLAKMSNKDLIRSGHIRIAGFTKADGTKVKSHIRKLKKGDIQKKSLLDLAGEKWEATDFSKVKDVAEFAIDNLTPVGSARASQEAFGQGKDVQGYLWAGATAVETGLIVSGLGVAAKASLIGAKAGVSASVRLASNPIVREAAEQALKKSGKVIGDVKDSIKSLFKSKKMSKADQKDLNNLADATDEQQFLYKKQDELYEQQDVISKNRSSMDTTPDEITGEYHLTSDRPLDRWFDEEIRIESLQDSIDTMQDRIEVLAEYIGDEYWDEVYKRVSKLL